ncbi:MAG: multi-sensor hybrid histidine kinase [Deltaproteobacteria bacterium]|nr:multi-sensor hybrid histidine kinase [Deltaproteobacteria bacterium]
MRVYPGKPKNQPRCYKENGTDYRSIFENAVEGFYKSTPEGKFLIVNPAMARILGYDSPEDLLDHVQDINHQYYASSERRKEFKRLLESQGTVQNFESEVLRKDGKKIWISSNARVVKDIKARPLYYEGFVTDITEHKRAEAALREGERFLASIFSSIQDGISILDTDLNIIRVNNTMEGWYPHASPLVGKKCYEAYRGDMKPCAACPALQVLRTGKSSYKLESKRGPNGEVIGWLDLYGFPLFDPDTGRMRGIIEYVRDISEQKITEEALKRSEEEARKLAADKMVMAEIGRIIGSTLNIEEVYERFAEEARKLIDFDRIAINLIDQTRGVGIQAYMSGIDVAGRGPGDAFPLAGSINEQILQTEKMIIISPREKKELEKDYPTLVTTFEAGLRSMMSVPLISNQRVIGVLHLRSRKSDVYREDDAKVAEGIAAQIAGAISNAQLYQERRRAEAALRQSEMDARRLAQENAIMAEIGQILCSTLNIDTVYERVSETVRRIIPFDRMAINIIQPEGNSFSIPYVFGEDVVSRQKGDMVPLSGTAAAEVIRTQASILIRKGKMEEFASRFPGILPLVKAGFQSIILIPLVSQDRVIGILNMQRSTSEPFTEENLRLGEKVGAQIAGAVANAQLYAERAKAERAHRESEEKYRLLVENANDAIFIIQDKVIRFSNPKTEELLGYEARELTSIPFSEHIHPLDRESIWGGNGSGEGKLLAGRTFRIRNRNGREFWVELNSVAILWDGRLATLNFARDITEQKKLEAQFLQAQKMEAVGRLAGGVAHDFNNLLTVINSHSQLALMELKEWDPLREKFESIQKAGEKAANLTRQLLAFSRRQVVEMKVIDLNAVLSDLEKMLQRLIGEDIELKTSLGAGLGRVKVDPGQIEQAILNLVVNARDAMPSGGKLAIETGNEEVDQEFTGKHIGLKPGRYVRLAVSDTGVGMPPEVKERLFEPFFTTKEKGKGTGLGLSTVYGAVKQSGGEIWVYSEPGLGTTVKIYLPLVDEPLEAGKRKTAGERMPTGQETILVVEDEDEVRKLAVSILSRQGYKVLEASHGGDALLMMENNREPIQLLLTDVVMPGINGPDFARRMKFVYPELKVLYMSGYADNVIFQHGILDQAMAFLQKPFTVERLAGKVREVLDA